ncbi:glucan biosynthesis protein [Sphingomonas profundi]|uniref:glucan biosynthesis protein n=1 Tax=Alterirhizorhabdus profundi TaxID=2681549 RepID=UPI0012E91934|nr:glucan biosynthesis protein [Sphingomonas profundi]
MADIDRRSALLLLAASTALPGAAHAAGRAVPFSWEGLQRLAAARAAAPFRPVPPVAGAGAIDFDAAGTLRYRADRTLLGGIRLFPLTATAPHPVRINLVEGGRARPVAFAPDLFEASAGHPALGLAGFRAITPGRDSDWIAFLGASYFRAAGSQDQYGLSARGIAIDTGIDGREEFPAFTDFWIERRGAQQFVVHALLDGPSVAGAFRFDCRHGADGVVQDASCVLFFRKDVARLGIAPCTSMFWYGEGDRVAATDWRPEIHDSDGLAIATGSGERIWRPLVNPPRATLDSFADRAPRGFGLIQRDRDFANYQDDGAFYDRRPNLWIEPKGDWGAGAVSLFAFPTRGETDDNVVAFWTPAARARRGARMAFDYRMTWNGRDPAADAPSRAIACRAGTAGRPGQKAVAGARKIVVDLSGEALGGLGRDAGVTVQADVARGRVLDKAAYPIVGRPGQWRAMIDVAVEGAGPADLRLYLRQGDRALSETILLPVY